MSQSTFTIGQKAVFNYDRKYMTDKRTRSHDGEIVAIIKLFQVNGNEWAEVENTHHAIYPCMIQELTICKG